MDTQRDKDSLFRALFEQTGEAVLLVRTADGTLVEANPTARRILFPGTGPEIDWHLPDLFDQDCREAFDRAVRHLKQSREPVSFTSSLRGKDGGLIPVEMAVRQVGEDMLVTFQDLTARIRAQEDLELRNIAIANVTSGVTVADARQPDLPLIYVNRGFQTITGYSAREAVGRSCRFLQGEDRDQAELDVLRAALRKGEACIVQLRNYRKDGSLFYNELHISPVHNEAGELTHFVGIQLDVTEQVRARESLQRSEAQYRQALAQEKELNEIKTRFISMVSHEFRTPMTGIQASASLLRKFGEKLPAEKRQRHLSNIESSLRRMNRLLDDVLFFSRAESGKVRVDRKPVDLGAHLRELVEHLGTVHPDREVRIEMKLSPESRYNLDTHLLDHILQNLVGNALKYSPAGTPVTCTVEEDADNLHLSVADRGIGIPAQDQKHLFEAFHRAGNVGTRQGTGLGLNIVRRAVELLNGEIRFSSLEDSGSTFTVRLPKHT